MTWVKQHDPRYPVCFYCKVFLYHTFGGWELEDGSFLCKVCTQKMD